MAGDWIKWAKGLARKPEVVQIAIRLGLSRHAVAGLLMEVWEWADENVVLNLSGSEPDDCPGCVPFEGTPEQLISALTGVTGLADAMTAAGWLRCRSGSLVFPNFNRHNGNTAKSRALDSSRKQRARTSSSSGPEDVPKLSGSDPDKSRTREEKRREEEKTPPNPPQGGGKGKTPPKEPPESVPIPSLLDTAEFREAWADWLAERRSRRKTVTVVAAKSQLDSLVPIGVMQAIVCIRESIRNGWTGLFPEKFKDPKPTPQKYQSSADRRQEQLEREFASAFLPPQPGES